MSETGGPEGEEANTPHGEASGATPGGADGGNPAQSAYWRANLRLLGVLMTIWFAGSFGAGILLREWLDQFSIGGYPLGFWFAQQGAIYLFIALIAVYVAAMRRIERHFDLDD